MKFEFLNVFLKTIYLRSLFPKELGFFSFLMVLILVVLFISISYLLILKVHEFLFFKKERTAPEEIYGKIKLKKTELKKSWFKKGKVKKVFITVISTRRLGDIFVEDKRIYEKFNKNEKVHVLFQKDFLVKRFQKDAKYLGVHVLNVSRRD